MERLYKYKTEVTLQTEDCPSCAGVFAMSADRIRRLRETGGYGYCPYCGKYWSYSETEIDGLKKKVKTAQDRLSAERARHDQTRASLKAQKAAKTRLKNRIKNGVCPCCNRHFKNLYRHMKNQHPEFEPCKS